MGGWLATSSLIGERSLGTGRLCLKHHLLFYSFIPLKWAYNSFQVAYYFCIIPSFCIPQVQNRPQNSEIELHAQR